MYYKLFGNFYLKILIKHIFLKNNLFGSDHKIRKTLSMSHTFYFYLIKNSLVLFFHFLQNTILTTIWYATNKTHPLPVSRDKCLYATKLITNKIWKIWHLDWFIRGKSFELTLLQSSYVWFERKSKNFEGGPKGRLPEGNILINIA